MNKKRLLTVIVLALFGTLGAATASVAALCAPVEPLGGCFARCIDDTNCFPSTVCPVCEGGLCVAIH